MPPKFKDPQDFVHQFMRANGQIIYHKQGAHQIWYPTNWSEDDRAYAELHRYEVIFFVRDNMLFPGCPMYEARKLSGMSKVELLNLVRKKKIGAVRKFGQWYLYMPSFMELLEKMRPENPPCA
jgi:hypothetical protein